jgi:hypothetical protein
MSTQDKSMMIGMLFFMGCLVLMIGLASLVLWLQDRAWKKSRKKTISVGTGSSKSALNSSNHAVKVAIFSTFIK